MAKSGVPLNLGPRTYDLYFNTEAKVQPIGADYIRAGVVKFSVNTDAPVIACEEFFLQATMTCRMGVDIATALRALTLEPAEAVGIADQCGSLDVGKDADVFCTTGNPLDPRSRPLFVLVRGALGFDHARPGDDRLPVPRTAAEGAPDVRFHHDDAAPDARPSHEHGDLCAGEVCPQCGAFDAEKARFAKRFGATAGR